MTESSMYTSESRKQNPLVSVIVPIYNVEPYLRKCVDSIINQTYKNLEIILVDDGSPDGCPAICDEYQALDSRVKVIHKSNGGLSDARNAGLDIATGDYITFIDSDDWYELGILSRLITVLKEGQYGIVSYACSIVTDTSRKNKIMPDETFMSREYAVALCEETKFPSVCTKIFKRKTIGENHFCKGRLNEDFLFLLTLLMHADFNIRIIPDVGYNYRVRQGSITRSGTNHSVADAVKNCMELFETAKRDRVALQGNIARMALHQSSVLALTMSNSTSASADVRLVASCIKKCYAFKNQKTLSARDKIIVSCIYIAPKLSVAIFSAAWHLFSIVKEKLSLFRKNKLLP